MNLYAVVSQGYSKLSVAVDTGPEQENAKLKDDTIETLISQYANAFVLFR
jgi:hypothetical protein